MNLKNKLLFIFSVLVIHCIVAKEVGGEVHEFTPDRIAEGIEFLSSAGTLIGHNILRFDLDVIKKLTGVDLYHKDIEDTLVMSRLFKPIRENGHSLKVWGYRVGLAKQEHKSCYICIADSPLWTRRAVAIVSAVVLAVVLVAVVAVVVVVVVPQLR